METVTHSIAALRVFGEGAAPEKYCHVSTFTGDRLGAGTDAKVWIKLFGRDGIETDDVLLDRSVNNSKALPLFKAEEYNYTL